MARPSRQLIESTNEMANNVTKTSQNQDYSDAPVKSYDPTVEVTKKQKKQYLRIEPRRCVQCPVGKPLTEDKQKEKDDGWEYVEGIFENRAIIGETMVFWHNGFPGDKYMEWVVPCNTAISVPRFIAKHLNQRNHVVFKYAEKPQNRWQKDEFIEDFIPDYVERRTTFMPLGMY